MNGRELYKAVHANLTTKDYFTGVYAMDELPIVLNTYSHPAFLIVNNQFTGEKGEHWLVVRLPSREVEEPAEVFDSLGIPPTEYHTNLRNLMILNGPKYLYNSMQLQGNHSNLCSFFCLYYIYFRTKGYSMHDIVNSFTGDYALNDNIANKVANHLFNISL